MDLGRITERNLNKINDRDEIWMQHEGKNTSKK